MSETQTQRSGSLELENLCKTIGFVVAPVAILERYSEWYVVMTYRQNRLETRFRYQGVGEPAAIDILYHLLHEAFWGSIDDLATFQACMSIKSKLQACYYWLQCQAVRRSMSGFLGADFARFEASSRLYHAQVWRVKC